MSTSIDTDLVNVRAQIKEIQQKRRRMRLQLDQERFALETRYREAASKWNNLRSHPQFYLYFGAMDEPNQAPYVTKKEALLCHTFLQIKSNTHQERLAHKHAIQLIRMLKGCVKKQQDEKRCMEESLWNQCTALRREILMRQTDENEAKMDDNGDDDSTSITAGEIQLQEDKNDSNRSFEHSLDFQVVLDGLSRVLFGMPVTELVHDTSTQQDKEHSTTND